MDKKTINVLYYSTCAVATIAVFAAWHKETKRLKKIDELREKDSSMIRKAFMETYTKIVQGRYSSATEMLEEYRNTIEFGKIINRM